MKIANIVAYTIAIIGALNWLLVGLFSFDLVAFLFGAGSVLTRIVYSLVGVAGIWMIFFWLVYKPFVKVAQ
ncbi:MAG: DUF378 domain-containing protein [Clostridia bacterium]|nr:DUF378 domain-containing protein [Clostridia bacterium]MBR1676357.1 DUF378 domain-containing protein [Clostridia bacterium]